MITKSNTGVWMHDEKRCESVSRMVAIDVMITLGLDPADFRTRDKIINGIHDRINRSLDEAAASDAVLWGDLLDLLETINEYYGKT